MVGVKDIKRRKKTIENTIKITKAMELVAFSKLKKSKERVKQTEPFFNKIYDVMADIAWMNQGLSSIFFNNRSVEKRCYIVIAGDKGLAGNYNGNLFRVVQDEFNKYNRDDIAVVSIGRKAYNFFKRQNFNLYYSYEGLSEDLDINLASDISKVIIEGFLKNQFQELYIIFTDFISVLIQKPNIKKILPLSFDENPNCKGNIKNKYAIYDPSPAVVLDTIIPQYITGVLYGAVVKSFAAEQGSRRIAMEAASKSAKDMLKDIDLMFNKARQSHITQEITEISAGAKAI